MKPLMMHQIMLLIPLIPLMKQYFIRDTGLILLGIQAILCTETGGAECVSSEMEHLRCRHKGYGE